MASSTLKGQHFDSFFGQFWLVLNPMLLALVYFLLTSVLAGQGGGMKHFVGLLTGLFAFFYTRNIIQFASQSITGGGKMIINMSFPKMLLPLSTTFTAMLMYFPTLLVYGPEDDWIPVRTSIDTRRRARRSGIELALVPGTRHAPVGEGRIAHLYNHALLAWLIRTAS